MEKENNKNQDDKLREILSLSKIKAGENLKYRIMRQIETESALSAKKTKSRNLTPLIRNTFVIFGVMYALIILAIIGVYLSEGIEAMKSLTFFTSIVMISLVCSMFWMISIFDDKRRFKQTKNSSQKYI